MNFLDELQLSSKPAILLDFRSDLRFCLLGAYLTLNWLEKVHIHYGGKRRDVHTISATRLSKVVSNYEQPIKQPVRSPQLE
jgi:hypothetical protein